MTTIPLVIFVCCSHNISSAGVCFLRFRPALSRRNGIMLLAASTNFKGSAFTAFHCMLFTIARNLCTLNSPTDTHAALREMDASTLRFTHGCRRPRRPCRSFSRSLPPNKATRTHTHTTQNNDSPPTHRKWFNPTNNTQWTHAYENIDTHVVGPESPRMLY